LAARYHDMNFIMKQDPQTGIDLMVKAMEKQREQRTWQLWVSIYPNMGEDNFIKYEEFKDQVNKKPETPQSAAEIIAEAEKTKALDQQGG